MSGDALLSLTVERFKSFEAAQRVDLAPLTVVLGRNNSGKSSMIQALLLLKQTLMEPRADVPLHLDGVVSAFNLRELTFGWPSPGPDVPGPALELRWRSTVDLQEAFINAGRPDRANLAKHAALADLQEKLAFEPGVTLVTRLRMEFCERGGATALARLVVSSEAAREEPGALFTLQAQEGAWTCTYRKRPAHKVGVVIDHFLPYLRINRSDLAPRDAQRAYYNVWMLLVAQPIEALRRLLGDFQYLGSTRSAPPSLYRASNIAPSELGASGELAAQLLHRRQREVVHYPTPVRVTAEEAIAPTMIRERSLVDAVNDVLAELSVSAKVSVEDVQEVGFRLLFGNASLAHVGRGLTYLLPFIELGLLADPRRFASLGDNISRERYALECSTNIHVAVEEPEAHLHPKVQSRLAHWLVALAMNCRRLIVETHSDHLVRRLRGLVARAGAGTELERWLLENVVILEVSQDEGGRSSVSSVRLSATGGLTERWPADFMDESSEEDSAIYYAGLAKEEPPPPGALIIHDEGDEPEVER
jgi:predicted ATPase